MMLLNKLYVAYWYWLSQYLNKRQPAAKRVTLVQKLIFILPTRFGWWFLLLIALLYLLGTNYQNNLILLLSYFLLMLFLMSIVLCYQNLRGLTITSPNQAEGYCYEPLFIEVRLHSTKHHAVLELNILNQPKVGITVDQQAIIHLPLQASRRGKYAMPRIRVYSHYPFGLWRGWSYVALDSHYWVYPKPDGQPTSYHEPDIADNDKQKDHTGDTLAPYRSGESVRHLLWKRLARDPLNPVVRQQQWSSQAEPSWVVVPPLSGESLEKALRKACFQLLSLEQSGNPYGLKLTHCTISQSTGKSHLTRCLQELALCR